MLIAACDTFRAGAVEQLRTHQRRLNSLHPPEKHGGRPVVQLYEKGYGKDAAGIAMEAIAYGKKKKQKSTVALVRGCWLMPHSTVCCTLAVKKGCGTFNISIAPISVSLVHLSTFDPCSPQPGV